MKLSFFFKSETKKGMVEFLACQEQNVELEKIEKTLTDFLKILIFDSIRAAHLENSSTVEKKHVNLAMRLHK